MSRPPAGLSLDLDNLWSYLRTHGDPGWEGYPSYLDLVVPRILEILAERDLEITFFLVGQDAALLENRQALRSIADAGHEIGNHSFRHQPWLHRYPEAELERELEDAETAIAGATGRRPEGFRGPGYSLSEPALKILKRRGYRYDASILPTWLGPLARAYYFRTARLDDAEREEREILFGTWRDGRRPVKPFRWRLGDETLLELPVTTLPLLKLPFHLSYLLYLGIRSHTLARVYFRLALGVCRATATPPSLLLHPLDFLGAEDCPGLDFFPAMRLGREVKLRRTLEFLDLFRARFDVLPLARFADAVERAGALPVRAPDFDA